MGNCFACFKEPSSTAVESSSNCRKKEMPEAQLFAAPSHVPASSAPTETILSNGNHLPSLQDVTTPTTNATTISTAVTATAAIKSFCPRKPYSKSTPAMGLSESRPSESKLNTLFEQYKDASEDSILAEGIEQLCRDLQINPDDFKILVLAWKLNAEQMCRFTRTEFVTGLKGIRVDSVKAIQTKLPELMTEVSQNVEQFKSLYRFTFRFGLDSASGQRILPTEMAVLLWRLVFTVRPPPILGRWLAFLESHPAAVRGIPRDTWNMFLNFSDAVGDDLSCYDDNEAWPSLFDDFVEYENDQANQNISKEDKSCEPRGGLIGQGD